MGQCIAALRWHLISRQGYKYWQATVPPPHGLLQWVYCDPTVAGGRPLGSWLDIYVTLSGYPHECVVTMPSQARPMTAIIDRAMTCSPEDR